MRDYPSCDPSTVLKLHCEVGGGGGGGGGVVQTVILRGSVTVCERLPLL